MQYKNWSISKNQSSKILLKNQSNRETNRSRKWSETLQSFIDQILAKQTDYLANRFSLGSELK